VGRLPVSPVAVRRLLGEIESSGRGEHFLAIGGAKELALVLQQQFFRGGADRGAVRAGGPEGADIYVHVLAGQLGAGDAAVLRRARLARVPAIAVVEGSARVDYSIPYVLATDVVWVGAGDDFPLEAIARVVAGRLGEDGAPLAAHIPLLREAVCDALIDSFARKSGVLAAAVWIPGADLPVLTLNQLRLVLRLAQAYGEDSGRERFPELVATLGAGLGLRALARELLELVPPAAAEGGRGFSAGRRRLGRRRVQRMAGWALKGAVAYGGTRSLGEAARRRFELASKQPPDAAARAWP